MDVNPELSAISVIVVALVVIVGVALGITLAVYYLA